MLFGGVKLRREVIPLALDEFEKIYLTKAQWKILKDISKAGSLQIPENIARSASMIKFLEPGVTGHGAHAQLTGKYFLSTAGINYVHYRKRTAKEKFLSNLRGWITTAIAVAAFVLSVIALILQSKK